MSEHRVTRRAYAAAWLRTRETYVFSRQAMLTIGALACVGAVTAFHVVVGWLT